ncbi:Protein argonaute [Friedmanniomyces endolithicus]|nr:Protein argonaute [Friedmanniomyces endolithicus]KAK0794233.1 Protein argonaute [Friedmanniomyces endolithicus]KAK0795627.1 Protein argonaute [Friedmanniomyces endolithicus]KAK0811144.1 Protein argonaute [Friedmanniomyces endolithicus]KAK0878385.1 Protein argonaute [Friedmanniomyces endolithicus]
MAGAPHTKDRVSASQNGGSNASNPSSGSGSGSKSNHSGGRRGDAPSSNVPSPADSSSGPRGGLGGYDGNRDSDSHSSQRNPATSRVIVDPKNFDLGMAGWSTVRAYTVPTVMPPRPAPSTLGQPIKVGLNTFRVNKIPKTPVYQYDVIIGNGTEKRGLMNKVWQSKAIRAALGTGWIYDGNKLAWSLKSIDREIRLDVDLDSTDEGGDGKPRKSGKENKHRVVIKRTNTVGFAVLDAYLEGRADFDNTVLESINFFDHLLRETPRQRYTQIKRSFFARGQTRFDLGSGVEAFKGVYQTLRIGHLGGRRACLTVNVDVANGMFWKELPVHQAALQLTGRRDINDLITAVKQGGESSRTGQDLKKMRKLHVVAKHRGKDTVDPYVIDKFLYKGARDHKFEKDGKKISVYDHFASAYNIRLQYPDLPLALMTKGKAQGKMTVLPMEVLTIQPNERYAYKMDERQTSNMIKFAVTPPAERYKAIEHGLEMLKWDADPVHKAFGVEISRAKTVVDARLITAPKVQFGTGDAKPGTSGRWDLKGKKFLTPNTAPLKCWGVCVVPGRRGGKPDRSVVQNFVTEFCKVYKTHGGRVENTTPEFTLAAGDDVGQWVTMLWNQTGNKFNARPQLLVFILPDKDSNTYGRIKRSGECRYGVVSQCMQYAHVQKCQGQYISNVCMKVNAKLGGSTARAIGPKSTGASGLFTVSTMVLGADVSHAAPGSQASSMAALTCSTDRPAVRYAAACQTNGYRVEMITTANINEMLKPMVQNWVANVGGGKFPSRIVYFRDGVSEGQYQHILQQEVQDMKTLLKTADPTLNIPFIVIVGSKRHHVRFFPEKGDKNGNPMPGTLVETGVTHPYENDFYLCGHSAIKGTARPAHYHVLLNEVNMSNEDIQLMIYEQSYQFMRSTTPVSQHPAIYYAHIASNRAIPHDPRWAGSSDGAPPVVASRPRSGSQSGGSQGRSGDSSSQVPINVEKLLPMPNTSNIMTSMWYI